MGIDTESLKNLKRNAVFQLSLSSKELFHSNFLYWIATSHPDFFNEVLKGLLCNGCGCHQSNCGISFQYNPEKQIVLREYNHFDFCICERIDLPGDSNTEESENRKEREIWESSILNARPGKVLFVLENKFKSIPYKEQLDEYRNKIEKWTKKTDNNKKWDLGLNPQAEWDNRKDKNCRWKSDFFTGESGTFPASAYVLLTLAKPGANINEAGWTIVQYGEYAKVLRAALEEVKKCGKTPREGTLDYQMIDKYIDFISTFAGWVETNLNKKSLEELRWEDMTNPVLQELRIQDIWQKLVVSKCLDINLFSNWEMITDDKKVTFEEGKIYKQLFYGFDGAAIGIYKKINDNIAYHVQVQGKRFKRGLYFSIPTGEKENDYNKYIEGKIENVLSGKNKEIGQYKGSRNYFYKYDEVGDKTIDEICQDIYLDMTYNWLTIKNIVLSQMTNP